MSMSELKLQAPIQLEMKVSVINDEGLSGVATVGLGLGRFPTEQEVRDRLKQFEAEEIPKGFRLMNKTEWWSSLGFCVADEDDEGNPVRGLPIAMPGGRNWDE